MRIPIRGLKYRARSAWTKYVLRMPPRSAEAYATCVPVLVGLAGLVRPRHVLEFGCGAFSTATFLNRSLFPDLVRLHSLENDPEWAHHTLDAYGSDPRLKLETIRGAMAAAAESIDYAKYDLVLIDDSTSLAERSATIRAAASRRSRRTTFVVHDFEQEEYRLASQEFRHRYRCAALNPNSGVLWEEAGITRGALRRLERSLRRNTTRLQPGDSAGWAAALAASC